MTSFPSRPFAASEPAFRQMTSSCVVPLIWSFAAVAVIVHSSRAPATLETTPWRNAGAAMSPAVVTVTKIVRSLMVSLSLSRPLGRADASAPGLRYKRASRRRRGGIRAYGRGACSDAVDGHLSRVGSSRREIHRAYRPRPALARDGHPCRNRRLAANGE